MNQINQINQIAQSISHYLTKKKPKRLDNKIETHVLWQLNFCVEMGKMSL